MVGQSLSGWLAEGGGSCKGTLQEVPFSDPHASAQVDDLYDLKDSVEKNILSNRRR